jgi:peptidoglycan hydrolase CwlO-like protein
MAASLTREEIEAKYESLKADFARLQTAAQNRVETMSQIQEELKKIQRELDAADGAMQACESFLKALEPQTTVPAPTQQEPKESVA